MENTILTTALLCLAANVFYESRGESIAGQYAVAQVTMNRADHQAKNVCKVVAKPKQFSWANHLRRHKGNIVLSQGDVRKLKKEPTAWHNAKQIAYLVLFQGFPDTTEGSTYYHAKSVHPAWIGHLDETVIIDNHIFYASR